MPNWKKLIVSGSDALLNSLNVTNDITASGNIFGATGSFTHISASEETRITGDLIPSADNTFNLGSTNTEDWKTLFVREIDIFNERLRISYDGTTATFRDHSSVGDGLKFFHRN